MYTHTKPLLKQCERCKTKNEKKKNPFVLKVDL